MESFKDVELQEYFDGVRRTIWMLETLHEGFPGMSPRRPDDPLLMEMKDVLAGRLIGLHDPEWNFEKAFPIISTFEVDGWEFVIRGYDKKYQFTSAAYPVDWVTAKLKEFTVEDICYSDQASWAYPKTGVVYFLTPSGRRHSERFCEYNDRIQFLGYDGEIKPNMPWIKLLAPFHRAPKSLEILFSYIQDDKAREVIEAARLFESRGKGSMGRLKTAVRALNEF